MKRHSFLRESFKKMEKLFEKFMSGLIHPVTDMFSF